MGARFVVLPVVTPWEAFFGRPSRSRSRRDVDEMFFTSMNMQGTGRPLACKRRDERPVFPRIGSQEVNNQYSHVAWTRVWFLAGDRGEGASDGTKGLRIP